MEELREERGYIKGNTDTPINHKYTVYNDSSVQTIVYTYDESGNRIKAIRGAVEGVKVNSNADTSNIMNTVNDFMEQTGDNTDFGRNKAIAKQLNYNGEALKRVRDVTIDDLLNEGFYTDLFRANKPRRLFQALATRVITLQPIPDLEVRNRVVYLLTESYANQLYETPSITQLNLLANWILYDEMTNSHPDKLTNTEYPIMTVRQLKARHSREIADEFIESKSSNTHLLPAKKKVTTEYSGNKI